MIFKCWDSIYGQDNVNSKFALNIEAADAESAAVQYVKFVGKINEYNEQVVCVCDKGFIRIFRVAITDFVPIFDSTEIIRIRGKICRIKTNETLVIDDCEET
jgi:hypothetical protein